MGQQLLNLIRSLRTVAGEFAIIMCLKPSEVSKKICMYMQKCLEMLRISGNSATLIIVQRLLKEYGITSLCFAYALPRLVFEVETFHVINYFWIANSTAFHSSSSIVQLDTPTVPHHWCIVKYRPFVDAIGEDTYLIL